MTPGADEALSKKDCFVIPDILCNAGGVIVSYFEWVQDLQGLFWSEAEVNNQLEKIMIRSFKEIYEVAQKRKLAMRVAAYVQAVGRSLRRNQRQGLVPVGKSKVKRNLPPHLTSAVTLHCGKPRFLPLQFLPPGP